MRAPLLGQAAALAALVTLSTCLTGSHLCPRSLDCARVGRHFCQPGSSYCGPCLRPLVENTHGRCVVKRRHAPHSVKITKGQTNTYPELDEEIDFLSSIISERRTESRLPAQSGQHISKPKEQQLSDDHMPPLTEPPSGQSVPVATEATTTTTANTTSHTPTVLRDPIILPHPSNDHVFIIMSSVFMVAGSLALIVAGACWVRLQKGLLLTQKMDSPVHRLIRAQAFDNLPGDQRLAHSAQMFHYQHQKQQMLSLDKSRDEPKVPDSGASTDEENEDGDFTVYECPGLAPTGEMEVKNPLFDDSSLYLHKFQ